MCVSLYRTAGVQDGKVNHDLRLCVCLRVWLLLFRNLAA